MAQRVLDDSRGEHRFAAAGKAVEPQERTRRSQPCLELWALDKPEASARVLHFASVVVVDRSIWGFQPVPNLRRHLTGPHQFKKGLGVMDLILDAARLAERALDSHISRQRLRRASAGCFDGKGRQADGLLREWPPQRRPGELW